MPPGVRLLFKGVTHCYLVLPGRHGHPAFTCAGIDEAKTELCVTVSKPLNPGFFRHQGFVVGVRAGNELPGRLAVDLCPLLNSEESRKDISP
jgi:hypothetical protein